MRARLGIPRRGAGAAGSALGLSAPGKQSAQSLAVVRLIGKPRKYYMQVAALLYNLPNSASGGLR